MNDDQLEEQVSGAAAAIVIALALIMLGAIAITIARWIWNLV